MKKASELAAVAAAVQEENRRAQQAEWEAGEPARRLAEQERRRRVEEETDKLCAEIMEMVEAAAAEGRMSVEYGRWDHKDYHVREAAKKKFESQGFSFKLQDNPGSSDPEWPISPSTTLYVHWSR